MDIVDLALSSATTRERAAVLLVEGFEEPSGWPHLASAREEVQRMLAEHVVTGVMPDANGPGRPDIFMSKRVPHGRLTE